MTFGFPVAAPDGHSAVTVRLPMEVGSTSARPRPSRLNRTLVTCFRWLPVSWTLESVVALWMPPQVEMQTTSLTLGAREASRRRPPPNAMPAPTESDATATAAATAAADPRPSPSRRPVPWASTFSPSPACGVSCRARAERAALRTRVSDSPPGRLSTPSLWFPRSATAGPRGFGRCWAAAVYPRPGRDGEGLDASLSRRARLSSAGRARARGRLFVVRAAPRAAHQMKTYVATPTIASATGTSSTPTARPSAGLRPRSPTPCVASASPSTRPTATPGTSWSSSTRPRSG